jgi:hypothetical protein
MIILDDEWNTVYAFPKFIKGQKGFEEHTLYYFGSVGDNTDALSKEDEVLLLKKDAEENDINETLCKLKEISNNNNDKILLICNMPLLEAVSICIRHAIWLNQYFVWIVDSKLQVAQGNHVLGLLPGAKAKILISANPATINNRGTYAATADAFVEKGSEDFFKNAFDTVLRVVEEKKQGNACSNALKRLWNKDSKVNILAHANLENDQHFKEEDIRRSCGGRDGIKGFCQTPEFNEISLSLGTESEEVQQIQSLFMDLENYDGDFNIATWKEQVRTYFKGAADPIYSRSIRDKTRVSSDTLKNWLERQNIPVSVEFTTPCENRFWRDYLIEFITVIQNRITHVSITRSDGCYYDLEIKVNGFSFNEFIDKFINGHEGDFVTAAKNINKYEPLAEPQFLT